MDTADTERLWERAEGTGVEEETEVDEALLEPEPEPIPEVSRDDREVDSQNYGETERAVTHRRQTWHVVLLHCHTVRVREHG